MSCLFRLSIHLFIYRSISFLSICLELFSLLVSVDDGTVQEQLVRFSPRDTQSNLQETVSPRPQLFKVSMVNFFPIRIQLFRFWRTSGRTRRGLSLHHAGSSRTVAEQCVLFNFSGSFNCSCFLCPSLPFKMFLSALRDIAFLVSSKWSFSLPFP